VFTLDGPSVRPLLAVSPAGVALRVALSRWKLSELSTVWCRLYSEGDLVVCRGDEMPRMREL